jgi:hypothetical protein
MTISIMLLRGHLTKAIKLEYSTFFLNTPAARSYFSACL